MSRIGRKPIQIPSAVTASISNGEALIKGPKGSLKLRLHPHVTVAEHSGILSVTVNNPENKDDRALWGLYGSLLRNMIIGVVNGFEKTLEISGVGFKAAVKGKNVELSLGYAHPVIFSIPEGIAISIDKDTIKVSGIDKALVGETAARLRSLKKPEPYKGKGIKYTNEVIRRKAGKAAAKAAS